MSNFVSTIPYEQNNIPYIMVEDDGSVMHAEVKIGNSRIMMGEPTEQFGVMPVSIYLYVKDSDKVYQSALDAGGIQ